MTEGDRRRIDKWLWYARLARTRTAAQGLAVSGRVRVNRERNVSASRPVRVGDVLTVAFDSSVKVLKVVALGDRRGPASEARLLYEDLSPAPSAADPPRQRGGPRPSKRDRRRFETVVGIAAIGEEFSPHDPDPE